MPSRRSLRQLYVYFNHLYLVLRTGIIMIAIISSTYAQFKTVKTFILLYVCVV
jgi:hypothetical protein